MTPPWRPCRRCGGRAYATRPWRQPPRLCRRCLIAVADVVRRAVVCRPEVRKAWALRQVRGLAAKLEAAAADSDADQAALGAAMETVGALPIWLHDGAGLWKHLT